MQVRELLASLPASLVSLWLNTLDYVDVRTIPCFAQQCGRLSVL